MHSTARLEPHTGHGTTGLPEQAVFRFSSEELEQQQQQREPVRGTGSGTDPYPANRAKSPHSPTLAAPSAARTAATNQSSIDAPDASSFVSGTAGGATRTGGDLGSPKPAGGGNAARLLPVHGRGDGSRRGSSPRGGDVSPRERGGAAKIAAGNLSVRAVEAVEMRDGRTVLVCLVSERGLASEVGFCVALFIFVSHVV